MTKEEFFAKVVVDKNDCHFWTGRPCVSYFGRQVGFRQAAMYFHGIPDRKPMSPFSTCGNTMCINPIHRRWIHFGHHIDLCPLSMTMEEKRAHFLKMREHRQHKVRVGIGGYRGRGF